MTEQEKAAVAYINAIQQEADALKVEAQGDARACAQAEAKQYAADAAYNAMTLLGYQSTTVGGKYIKEIWK